MNPVNDVNRDVFMVTFIKPKVDGNEEDVLHVLHGTEHD